jgi:hypothetical protein
MNSMSKKKQPGPDPERLKIEGDWEDAVKKAMGKKRPKEGWPEPEHDKRQSGGNDEK